MLKGLFPTARPASPLRSERAATLVETVIILPLFLFLILLVIWIGVSFHERATLATAVGAGIRAASTRSDMLLMNSQDGIISAVQGWIANPPTPQELRDVLAYNLTDPPNANEWGEHYYQAPLGTYKEVFGEALGPGAPIYHLPKSYIYTLIYIHESIRQSVGKSVRFPCDPTEGGITPPIDRNGCVGCRFLNPETFDFLPHPTIPTDRIAIQCQYRPANMIFGPLTRMLSLMTGSAWTGSPFILSILTTSAPCSQKVRAPLR